jgi:hypoxanthine phosphoribosyltransferase
MKSTESVKIVRVSPEKIQLMIEKIVGRIRVNNEKFSYVVGIERGGLNVSIPLAKMLNLPHKSIKISYYGDGNIKGSIPTVDMHGHEFNKTDNVLFVDDLVDSGATVVYIKENIHCKQKFAVLYHNKNSKYEVVPDYYADVKFLNTWLVFPWEEQ